jgi:hypothetical protein
MSRRPSSRSKSLQQVEGEDSFLLLDRIRIERIQTLTLRMSGSYLDTMSDPPSWTSMTSSGKGTRPQRIRRRLSGRRRVSSSRHKRAPPRDGSTAAHSPSGERHASASGLVGGTTAHRQQPRVVCPDLGLGHCRKPARRQRANLRVNVACRRAG